MYLLFEVGGTKTRIGYTNDLETITSSQIIPTPQNPEELIHILKQQKVQAACGSLAGVLDQNGVIVKAPHLSIYYINKPIRQLLKDILETPVFLANDTELAGLGEAIKGAGAGYNIVDYIPVGTGVGGAKISNGKIDEHSQGFEPGHQIIHPNGFQCACGGKGHLEAYIAGPYLERLYGKKGEDIKDEKIWDEIALNLAIGLHNSIVFWSPDVIILGGGVSKSIPVKTVEHHLKQLLTIFPKTPPILLSSLGELSGLYGALEYLNQSLSKK